MFKVMKSMLSFQAKINRKKMSVILLKKIKVNIKTSQKENCHTLIFCKIPFYLLALISHRVGGNRKCQNYQGT